MIYILKNCECDDDDDDDGNMHLNDPADVCLVGNMKIFLSGTFLFLLLLLMSDWLPSIRKDVWICEGQRHWCSWPLTSRLCLTHNHSNEHHNDVISFDSLIHAIISINSESNDIPSNIRICGSGGQRAANRKRSEVTSCNHTRWSGWWYSVSFDCSFFWTFPTLLNVARKYLNNCTGKTLNRLII